MRPAGDPASCRATALVLRDAAARLRESHPKDPRAVALVDVLADLAAVLDDVAATISAPEEPDADAARRRLRMVAERVPARLSSPRPDRPDSCPRGASSTTVSP